MRSIRTFLLAGLAGLALGGMGAGVAAAQDGFQLPPSPGSGDVQGPVAEGVPPPQAPEPEPTQAPSPRATASPSPAPTAEPTQAPSPTPSPSPRVQASPSPAAEEPRPAAMRDDRDDAEDAASETADEAVEAILAEGAETAGVPEVPYPAQVPLDPLSAPEPAADEAGWSVPWTLIVLALLALAGAGFALWWWRRESTGREIFVIPVIQRPRPVERPIYPEPAGPAAGTPPPGSSPVTPENEEEAPLNPLRVALEPRQLRLSLVNATLSYRLLLTNSGEVPLTDIAISGDMISAHSSLPPEQQIAAPDEPLEPIQTIERLAPGESRTVSGQFQLPLPMIRPIRRGEIALFVPLARLSIVARGENGSQPTVMTSVVGQIPPRGAQGLQPFRLDLGPRTYSDLSQRAFA